MIEAVWSPVGNYYAAGRTADDIDGCVVHCTVGWSLERELDAFAQHGTSAHYCIDRDGTLYRHVAEEHVAYHAAAFGSKPGLNREENRPTWLREHMGRYSAINGQTVGIELIGTPDTTFTDAQYERLAELIRDICRRQNIPIKFRMDHGNAATIVAHADLQNDRSDPGPDFDWQRLKRLVEGDGHERREPARPRGAG